MSTALAKYLLSAMIAWQPPSQQPEGEEAALVRYESIASDVDEDLELDDEPAVFADDDAEKTKTGLLLLSMAYSESNFFARVDEGRCKINECDGGLAFSMWQIHTDPGIAFDGLKWKYDRKGFHGRDLVASRKLTIRVVLHLLRGPHGEGWADGVRLARAVQFLADHPR